jgi:hypothetical protein
MDESHVLSLDWYAGAVFYIDHGFIFETQLSDMSSKFNFAANGMIGVRVHYMTKSVREDVSPQILRTTYGVSVGGDDQHPILVLCLVHFDACNTIAATTDIWNMILTAKSHSEGEVQDNTSKGRIRDADFYDFNLYSIGGYVTAKAVTAPMVMALISRCSYDNSHTIDATTDFWDKIIATSMHSEYVVRSGTTGGIREADFCNVNITNASVGGYVTTTKPTTVLTAPTLQSEPKIANHWNGG